MLSSIIEQCFNHLKDLAKFAKVSDKDMKDLTLRQMKLTEMMNEENVNQDKLFAELDYIELTLLEEALSISEDMLWPDPLPQLNYQIKGKPINDNGRFRVISQ